MLNTPHLAVGMLIGKSVGNGWLAFFLGFLSHFILDAIPHWDGVDFRGRKLLRKKNLILIFDFILIFFILLILLELGAFSFSNEHLPMIFGAMGGVFPDIFWIPYYFLGLRWPKQFFRFHGKIQIRLTAPLLGLLIQVVIISFSIWFIIKL
ncbi:MAG: hypothetical protein ACK4NX_00075 [Candidatus Paceibacteria bacterium]